MSFYAAGISAYNGDRESWSQSIKHVMQEAGDNPYYRWALGNE